MNSDSARPVPIKREEPEDTPDINILHMAVCKEEVSPNHERSPCLLQEEPGPPHIKEEQEEPEPPHIKEEQEELLQRPEEPGGSVLTSPAVKSEVDEDVSSHGSEVELELESDTEDTDEEVRAQFFSCPVCQLGFSSQLFLHNHIRGRHHDLYWQMKRDGQITPATTISTASQSGNLKTLPPIYTIGKLFHCKRCDKSFNEPFSLKEHQHVHAGERFYCEDCDKSFSHSSALKRHQRDHSGEKPFHCNHCDWRFSRSSTLKTHQRVHSGEKPFHCQHCDKRFSQSSVLSRHQRVHSGEKTFSL